jgi:hypothetical protein
MAARLDQALSDAGVEHRCEIYEGALMPAIAYLTSRHMGSRSFGTF